MSSIAQYYVFHYIDAMDKPMTRQALFVLTAWLRGPQRGHAFPGRVAELDTAAARVVQQRLGPADGVAAR
jgi:hypothetical protein